MASIPMGRCMAKGTLATRHVEVKLGAVSLPSRLADAAKGGFTSSSDGAIFRRCRTSAPEPFALVPREGEHLHGDEGVLRGEGAGRARGALSLDRRSGAPHVHPAEVPSLRLVRRPPCGAAHPGRGQGDAPYGAPVPPDPFDLSGSAGPL